MTTSQPKDSVEVFAISRALVPLAVRFVHPGTATPLHQQTFGTAIEFGADNNVLILSAAQWALPSPHAAPELHELHERAVVDMIPPLEEDPLLTRLRRYLGE